MSGFIINGQKKKLSGILPVRGAKNASLKAFAASLLFKNGIHVDNVPFIKDIDQMSLLLEKTGVSVEKVGKRSFFLKRQRVLNTVLDADIAKSFRSSIVLTGLILSTEGEVKFPHPGGCLIGTRPIDVFLRGFRAMGASCGFSKGVYSLKAKSLKGARIIFRIVSVTGTETLMMAAVLAKGRTVLENAACEPEVAFLADFLNSCGARIKGAGTPNITIEGVKNLKSGKFVTPPDRIEAGSFAIIAALAGKKIRITNCLPEHLSIFLETLKESGVGIKSGKNWFEVAGAKVIKPVNIKTREYPGFVTDLQQPFTVLLTQARGESMIFETVFDGRLDYINDLNRMGAKIVLCDPHRIIVSGPTPLRGRHMESPDLRAGLAFVIAAIIAKGRSFIDNIHHIDRGYEKIEERLQNIGVNLERV